MKSSVVCWRGQILREAVAKVLRENDVSLFYDNYEEAALWGKDSWNTYTRSIAARHVIALCSYRATMPRRYGRPMSGAVHLNAPLRQKRNTYSPCASTTPRFRGCEKLFTTFI